MVLEKFKKKLLKIRSSLKSIYKKLFDAQMVLKKIKKKIRFSDGKNIEKNSHLKL